MAKGIYLGKIKFVAPTLGTLSEREGQTWCKKLGMGTWTKGQLGEEDSRFILTKIGDFYVILLSGLCNESLMCLSL